MIIQQWHPAAEAFPLMQGEKFKEFAEDIRANGVLKPIEFYNGDRWPEFKGFGIDGRNRQKACALLNLDPPVRALTDADVGASLTSYIASVNVSRRQLTTSQAGIVAVELKKQLEIENHTKKIEGAKRGAVIVNSKLSGDRLPERFREGELKPSLDKHENESARQAAKIVGSNEKYVRDAEKICTASAGLANLVRDDKLKIPQALSALKQREAHQEAFTALEEGRIDFSRFRDFCYLKGEHADLWDEFRSGQIIADEAIKTAKERKTAEKKARDAEVAEAITAADVKKRVESAFKDLGDKATVAEIAGRAGVSVQVADKIIFGMPDEEDDETDDSSGKSPDVPRGEEIGAGPDGELNYLAKTGEPTDRLNRPLDLELVPVFLDVKEFDSLIEVFGQCKTRVVKLSERHAAVWVNSRTLIEQLEKFQEHLRLNSPYCVCPSCSGTGKQGDNRAKDCPTCYGKSFICEGDFQEMNKDLQEIAKGYKS